MIELTGGWFQKVLTGCSLDAFAFLRAALIHADGHRSIFGVAILKGNLTIAGTFWLQVEIYHYFYIK